MERYFEIEGAVLAAKSDEAIETLIELEIAHEGIMPVLKPTPPSLEDVNIKRTVQAYKVGDRYYIDEEQAIIAAGLTALRPQYDYAAGGYDYKWLEPVTEQAWERVCFYEHRDVLRVREGLQRNREKQEVFKKANEEYREYVTATTKIRNAVWEAVTDARRAIQQQETARAQYGRYLELADEDEETARRFFRDAYKEYPELIKAVLNEEPQTDEETSE